MKKAMRTVRNKVQSGIDFNIMYILNILISTDIETERSRVAKTNETLSLPSCVCVFVLHLQVSGRLGMGGREELTPKRMTFTKVCESISIGVLMG